MGSGAGRCGERPTLGLACCRVGLRHPTNFRERRKWGKGGEGDLPGMGKSTPSCAPRRQALWPCRLEFADGRPSTADSPGVQGAKPRSIFAGRRPVS